VVLLTLSDAVLDLESKNAFVLVHAFISACLLLSTLGNHGVADKRSTIIKENPGLF